MRDTYVRERDTAVVCRHVEGPEHFLDLDTWGVHGRQERGDTAAVARFTADSGHDHIVFRRMDTGVPRFLTVDDPLVTLTDRAGFHVRGIGSVVRLCDTERKTAPTFC